MLHCTVIYRLFLKVTKLQFVLQAYSIGNFNILFFNFFFWEITAVYGSRLFCNVNEDNHSLHNHVCKQFSFRVKHSSWQKASLATGLSTVVTATLLPASSPGTAEQQMKKVYEFYIFINLFFLLPRLAVAGGKFSISVQVAPYFRLYYRTEEHNLPAVIFSPRFTLAFFYPSPRSK